MLVDMRPIGLQVPPHAAVRHGLAIDLDDDEVTLGIAALEVRVARGDALGSLDAIVADTFRPGGDEARDVRVVRRPAERAEADAVELWKCCYGRL